HPPHRARLVRARRMEADRYRRLPTLRHRDSRSVRRATRRLGSAATQCAAGGADGDCALRFRGMVDATPPSRVRPPAVAGSFYPEEPGALRSMVEACLAQARQARGTRGAAPRAETPPPSRPKAVIAPHAREHSLEVQLPFLQVLLGDELSVLPIVSGDATASQVSAALERVWGGDETLIIISSDLSHYLDYASARAVDAATAKSILAFAAELDADQACGHVAINGLLCAARQRHLNVRLLDLRNSGDTQPDRSRVVGYGAFAVYEGPVRQ